ncbi:hypothetical protein [Vibrio celticus]|uniref:Uncharacterized protein n=1 Tax=Vibrio celticus TaxID=446372 RepID=A0A1C3JG78_9VIBR|nr:hypothetical protein [Vibrio celticus]SBT14190.1 hypothetical protein VCE7224_02952 [Vibrio celticus]
MIRSVTIKESQQRSHTIEVNKAFAENLPWKDTTAFDRQTRGLIAELTGDAAIVRDEFPHYADMSVDEIPNTVNPSS